MALHCMHVGAHQPTHAGWCALRDAEKGEVEHHVACTVGVFQPARFHRLTLNARLKQYLFFSDTKIITYNITHNNYHTYAKILEFQRTGGGWLAGRATRFERPRLRDRA